MPPTGRCYVQWARKQLMSLAAEYERRADQGAEKIGASKKAAPDRDDV